MNLNCNNYKFTPNVAFSQENSLAVTSARNPKHETIYFLIRSLLELNLVGLVHAYVTIRAFRV